MTRQKHNGSLPPSYRWSQESVDRGNWAEDLFKEASRLINNDEIPERVKKPEWLTWIDPPSSFEDIRGTDAWARTDRADIPIQIKTSLRGAREHFRDHPKWNGLILVISEPDLTPADVAESTVNGLHVVWLERGVASDSHQV